MFRKLSRFGASSPTFDTTPATGDAIRGHERDGKPAGVLRVILRVVQWGLHHPNLLLNVAVPLGVYQALTQRGVPVIDALIAAAAFPSVAILIGIVRNRRLDPLGALSLIAIAVGVVGALIFRDPRLLLVKESVVTGLLGIACLGSLFASRPLIFILVRHFATGNDRVKTERYDRLWESVSYRAYSRRITLIWGIVLVAEASVRVGLSFALAPAAMLVASRLLAIGTFAPLFVWTFRRSAVRIQQTPAEAKEIAS